MPGDNSIGKFPPTPQGHIGSDPRIGLLKEFGSIQKIPPERLQAAGLRSLYDEEKGVRSLITEKEYQQKRSACLGLLHNYEGYLFANHLDRIHRFIDGNELIDESVINYARTRGEGFKSANIPPIFNKEFFNPSILVYPDLFGEENIEIKRRENLFPNIDFIIQYATGAYDRKRAAIALEFRNKTGRERRGIPIRPATVGDVIDFRRMAFTPEGRISTLLIRETAAYVKKHFVAKTEERTEMHESTDRMIFLFLEEMLKDFKVKPTEYKGWDGGVDMVAQPRWYLEFSPEDRIKIAKAYFSSVKNKPTGKARSVFTSMKVLFPEMAEEVEMKFETMASQRTEEQLQQAIAQAEVNRDFSKVPERAFVEDPWRDKYLPRLEQFFIETCERLLAEDPPEFFTNIKRFFEKVPVPRRLVIVPHVHKIFDGFRVRAAEALTDEQFKLLFTGEFGKNRYASIGVSRGSRTDEVLKLRKYLQQRLAKLKS